MIKTIGTREVDVFLSNMKVVKEKYGISEEDFSHACKSVRYLLKAIACRGLSPEEGIIRIDKYLEERKNRTRV